VVRVCVCIHEMVCVCMCVRESVFVVCVRVCVRERERVCVCLAVFWCDIVCVCIRARVCVIMDVHDLTPRHACTYMHLIMHDTRMAYGHTYEQVMSHI